MNQEKIYNEVINLRQQIIKNKKAMKYYDFFKKNNKNDLMYGWIRISK